MSRGTRSAALAITVALVASCTSGSDSTPQSSAPPVSRQDGEPAEGITLPPPPAPIAVVTRVDVAEPTIGDVVTVTTYVLADSPIASLQLWAGSQQVDTVDVATPATRVNDVLEWTATDAGLQALLVRAVDAEGRIAQSFPVWLRVAENPDAVAGAVSSGLRRTAGIVPPPDAEAGDGCTVEVTVPPAPADGIAVYAAVFGGGGFVAVDVLGPAGGTVPVAAGSGPVVVYTEAFTDTLVTPSAPTVTDPCPGGAWSGELDFDGALLTADVDHAYLYVSTDGDTWNRAPAADQTFVAPDADGRFDFSGLLPATGAGGETTVEGWGWKAGTLVALGRATFAANDPGNDSADDGAAPLVWAVVPGAPILPTNGSLDWVLSTVDYSDMQNPVKGESLLRSGLLCTYTKTPGPLFILPSECDNAPSGVLPSTTFRWQPAPGTFTHGVWQVSVVPPPDAPVLSFPGLIGTGPVLKPTTGSIDFEITDLAAMLASTAPTGTGQVTASAAQAIANEAISFETISAIAAVAMGAGAAPSAGTGDLNVLLPPSWTGSIGDVAMPITPVQQGLYVRVVPVEGAQPQAQTSNLVAFDLDHTAPPPPPPPPDPAFTLTGTIQPPTLPNPALAHCVRVVENPFGSTNPAPGGQYAAMAGLYKMFEASAYQWQNGTKVHKGLVPGATVCALEPSPPEDNWYDIIVDAIEAVAWVWDLYADVYGMLKDKIVEALVLATNCEALFSESECKAIGGFVVNMAAVAVGLPPTLPKFSELMEGLKGDLKAKLITLAVQSGVLDCGEELQAACEKVAEEMLDELIDYIEKEASEAATAQAKSGGYTLLLNPAIKVIPEPAGTMAPAVFQLTLTRTAAPSTTTSCTISGSVTGTTTWSWDADDGYHTKEEVTATLMSGMVSVDVTGMATGATKQVTLVLDNLYDIFLPGQPPWKGSYINPEYDPSTWIFFFPPTVQRGGAGTPCAWSATNPSSGVGATWPQDNNSTQPWEIS